MVDATKNITYNYDPAGNRQTKTINNIATYYVRDAQGNTLATYQGSGTLIKWTEQHLYGSSRLGIWKPNIGMYMNSGTSSATAAWKLAGLKQYELTNHLGNVMATISDKRIGIYGNYQPDLVTAQDYYAFG